MPKFIELTFPFGVKRLLAIEAVRRVDKREGYDSAEIVCERGLKTLRPNEKYDEIVALIRNEQTLDS